MKKIFLMQALLIISICQVTMAQTISKDNQLSGLLESYYGIKDALVAGNASAASAHARSFTKAANAIDYKIISEGNINALLKDAGAIAAGKNVKKQREIFSNLSNNMLAVAKAVKLSDQPVYQQYCPMKKASWLSSEQAIRNPYYGNEMLGCGEVTNTY